MHCHFALTQLNICCCSLYSLPSSSPLNLAMHTTGPKISSCIQREESFKPVMTVGGTKYPENGIIDIMEMILEILSDLL